MTPYEQLALIVAEQKAEITLLKAEIEALRLEIRMYDEVYARLRAALEEIAKGNHHYGQLSLCDIARKALAKEET